MSDTAKSQLREALTPVFTEAIPNDPEVSHIFARLTGNPERLDPHITLLATALGNLMAGQEVNYGAVAHWHEGLTITDDQYTRVIDHLIQGINDYDRANDTVLSAQLAEAYHPVSGQIQETIVNGTIPSDLPPAA